MIELPTPETDAKASPHIGFYSCATVPANFARALERERDEAREKYDTEATENVLQINKICNQRDEAMDVLEQISLYLSSGMGDDSTTAQQYKERILDGIKHLAGHAWEERCKYEKKWKESNEALKEAWLAMDEIEGTDRIVAWQNKHSSVLCVV
jgi:hypothetical protein